MKTIKLLFLFILFTGSQSFLNTISAKENRQLYFSNFPCHCLPQKVGKKLCYHFLESKHRLYGGRSIHYAEVCTWYGALCFGQTIKDTLLVSRLKCRFDKMLKTEKKLLPPLNHVDYNMFGCLPLRLYELTGDTTYLNLGLSYADSQWIVPANASEKERAWGRQGYSWQTRLWIDDMFMITIVQAEAYKATRNMIYINRAAREMCLYLDKLQTKDGLFYHAPDAPYYWGRGNGWVAAGMTEMLLDLPQDSPYRSRIMRGYRLMMKSLKEYVNRDGLWNQLVDQPDFWTETSGSAMFSFAMIKGVEMGWLRAEEYGPVARRAWMQLCNYIDDNNNVTEVCAGTGKKNDFEYYRERQRITGDYHGQAPVIWCAAALSSDG